MHPDTKILVVDDSTAVPLDWGNAKLSVTFEFHSGPKLTSPKDEEEMLKELDKANARRKRERDLWKLQRKADWK